MPSYYEEAKRMLGVTTNKQPAAADELLYSLAKEAGVESTYYHTDVGIFFGNEDDNPGTEYPDPYFEGEGPARSSCIACGGCMVGCRYNAKNSLDKNYLYLAEKLGTEILSETRVVDVRPLGGALDGSKGYKVSAKNAFLRWPSQSFEFTAKNVIFAASSLGTQSLLFHLKEKGSLPNISDDLGNRVRTNSESILAVRYPGTGKDLSKGIAIGSGIYIDHNTHIEAVRYPDGSNLMSGLFTVLTHGRAGWVRVFYWALSMIRLLASHPAKGIRSLLPWRFSRETVIFLVMQTIDGHINMRWKRRWFWPFKKDLCSEGEPIPTFIPEANEFTEKSAKATGGIGLSSLSEIAFNVPTTAHCMGGCAMSDSPETGVIDSRNRVFNYRNLYVIDGSILSANLGVNPSLTITALAERAMSFIPDKLQISQSPPISHLRELRGRNGF